MKYPLSIFLSLAVCMSSCGVYRNSFECPPGKGIGCAPVGKVLDLIVEREEGEDIFAKDSDTAFLLKQQEKEARESEIPKVISKKTSYLIRDEKGNLKLVLEPTQGSP